MRLIDLEDQVRVKLPNSKKRVAVIEVGSRAIRMLVADVGGGDFLAPVRTDYKQSRLLDALRADHANRDDVLSATKDIALQFVEKARASGASEILVVGTAACRELIKICPDAVDQVFPQLHILSGKSEAICSAIAAIDWSRDNQAAQRIVTIDHGAGSMEISVICREGNNLLLEDYRSYKLGSTELKLMLAECGGDVGRFSQLIGKRIASYKFEIEGHVDKVAGLGSVLTNTAWLFVREGLSDTYDPRRVHGKQLGLLQIRKTIQELFSLANNDIQKLRAFVDPRKPNGDEYEIIVTGLVAIGFILDKFNASEIGVSAHGARHGVALLLGSSNLVLDEG